MKLFLIAYILFFAEVSVRVASNTFKDVDSSLSSNVNCPEFFRGNERVPCYLLEQTCYCFSTQMFLMTWNDAKYYCRQGNYTLLSIETEQEDILIHEHINNTEELHQPWFWTSGVYSDNQWIWSTGLLPGYPMTYTNWAETRPFYHTNGYCVEINYSIYQGGWADFPCDFTNFFICEGNYTMQL